MCDTNKIYWCLDVHLSLEDGEGFVGPAHS